MVLEEPVAAAVQLPKRRRWRVRVAVLATVLVPVVWLASWCSTVTVLPGDQFVAMIVEHRTGTVNGILWKGVDPPSLGKDRMVYADVWNGIFFGACGLPHYQKSYAARFDELPRHVQGWIESGMPIERWRYLQEVWEEEQLRRRESGEDRNIALLYLDHWGGRESKVALTPDLFACNLLALAKATVNEINDRRLWYLRMAHAEEVGAGEVLSRDLVLSDDKRRAVCGGAFTPVWGGEDFADLEQEMACRIGAGMAPWTGLHAELADGGVALWGRHDGLHLGASPMSGGFADEQVGIDAWRARCASGSHEQALEQGGVTGLLLFRALKADPLTEQRLIELVRRGKPWRDSASTLRLRSVSREPGQASFVGDIEQWRALRAAAQRLLEINDRLVTGASRDMPSRMRPPARSAALSAKLRIRETLLPLLEAAIEARPLTQRELRLLDFLFQPMVDLRFFEPEGMKLDVLANEDDGIYRAHLVAR